MNLFGYGKDATGEEPARCVEGTSPGAPGLGDIAVLMGHIEGRWAEQFLELNQAHVWEPPLRDGSQETDAEIDDEKPEPWRGQMHASISLDRILCHSFLKLPTRQDGWRHGAETMSSRRKGERLRDMLYPLNAESGISSSMFRIDFAPGPNRKPTPRITPELDSRHPPIRIEIGTTTLRRDLGQSVMLDRPAKIYLNDNDPDCLNFWIWSPTRNAVEQRVFKKHTDAFYKRGNCMDEAYFPGLTSTGGSTRAPSRAGYETRTGPTVMEYETRTGLSGTVYQIDGSKIGNGAFRDVYPVKIIGHPVSNLVVPEQTAIQKRQAEMLKEDPQEYQSNPPKPDLVAKVVRLPGNDDQSKQNYREMLEIEAKFVMNHPHPHVNQIYDISYKPGADDRPWIIEQRQKYCLDDECLPFPIDKLDMAKQLLCGLKYLHFHGIMHRDIKPANVMLELIKYYAEGRLRVRWVAKYTDHGMVASTNRMVKGRCGSPWYCAPEVLDNKPYNEKADSFSAGVMMFCMIAEYDPFRKQSNWSPASSSQVRLWMNEEVGPIIETECPQEWRVFFKGMLLENPKARWSVDKGLDYLLSLDQSPTRDSSSNAPSLPWTTGPFTEEEKRMTKKEVFRRNGVMESDDELSDSASTITPTALGIHPDGRALEDDVPVTPKLSCPAELPVTPCQGLAGEDALPSATCTPVFGDEATARTVKQVVDQPAPHDFSAIWDWGELQFHWRKTLPARRAPTSAFAKPRPNPRLQPGITNRTLGFTPFPQTRCSTKAERFSSSQQLTKELTNAIQSAEGEDSEAETERLDGDEDPEVPPDTHDHSGPEDETGRDIGDEEANIQIETAETERDVEDRGPEAAYSTRRGAQTNAPTNDDHENEQREGLNDRESLFLLRPFQPRKRAATDSTEANKRVRNNFNNAKEINLGGGRFARVLR
ncbi:hypothetical protein AYL99_12010 [Fonsecaea erecta]|uniref:Serine/threonine-protein kinase ATG1 n=1 Tax=Fonsecaea erecta TaxID=1367422 RepID=A0A178Z2Q1_9EURO|nr:hypothetical protein AYL99_12010 [Fonsecaea erecta]OAP53791.1 hypothetical protein AYL99_12010 [Fonsecaea erecta]